MDDTIFFYGIWLRVAFPALLLAPNDVFDILLPNAKFDTEFEFTIVFPMGGSLDDPGWLFLVLLVDNCFLPYLELCALVPARVTVSVGD